MSRHPDYELILAKYMKEGRITAWPRRREHRAVLLDFLSQSFEPDVDYPEKVVNEKVAVFHDDFAMLRRYLVDEGFMDRDHGIYRRAGGRWEVD